MVLERQPAFLAVKQPIQILPSNNPIAVNVAAVAMLALMAVLMVSSTWNDTVTMDEVPHIGAGFSYLRKSDFRLNPEHPPLMKDLAGIPLLMMKLRVDWNHKSWTDDPFGQWDFGLMLIFNAGRDGDTVTRAAKAPMILFTLALGWVVFAWTRRYFGAAAALLTLFFYTLSPTFLAHGRLVTTDVGAAAGYFVGTVVFLRFLKNPGWRNVLLAGLAIGFALLAKFSMVALIPVALILATIWALLDKSPGHHSFLRFHKRSSGSFVVAFRAPYQVNALLRYLTRTAAALAIAFLVVYAVYWHHMMKYPEARQLKDAEFTLNLYEVPPRSADAVMWMFNQPLLRPWGEYFLGLASNMRRSEKGNDPFFLGRFYETGSRLYFPFVYLVKEPLTLHLLTIFAFIFALSRAFSRIRRAGFLEAEQREHAREWLRSHYVEFAFLVAIAVFWWAAVRSNLNIGVRHLLSTFPLIYVLVSNEVTSFHRQFLARPAVMWAFRVVLGALLVWHAVSVVRVHPSYLPYFNELAGGADGGWRYVTDSNVDWGQELKRLSQFVEKRGIRQIHLDYFGTADPAYYLDGKYQGLSSCMQPVKGWVAVSAFTYQDSRRKPECDYRRWLPMEKLVTKIGYALFVFRVD